MRQKVTGRIRERYNSKGELSYYQVILYHGKDAMNKKKEVFLRADTREEAEELLERSLAECTLGTFLPVSQRTLEDYIMEEYLPVYCRPNVKSTSYKAYLQSCKYICRGLGSIKLSALNTTVIQSFFNSLMVASPFSKKPLSYATVAGIRRDLNVFLRKAVELKYIASNPVEGTKLTKPRKNLDKEKTEVLSKGQVKQLLEFVKGTPEELHYSLMIDASLRRGEATGLLWSDVDFDNSCIKIRNNWVEGLDGAELTTPKTQSSFRTVKLTDYTMGLLQREFVRYKKCRMLNKNFINSNRVVYQSNGKPMLPKSYYRKFKRTLKKAGLPDISMHDLRHTSITLQIEAGANIKSVSQRAGHSDTQITSNVYTHCTHVMDDETVNIMTGILSNAV